MIGSGKLLALITARGGSKRLPGKNILQLVDKPLIAWTIEAGIQSQYIDRVIVSTDDETIANISKEYGADVPFMRPDELASDKATSIDVARHAIQALEESGEVYDYLLLLQPTSPLRTSKHINNAVELFISKQADSVISVCELEHPIEWVGVLPDDLSMDNFFCNDEHEKRSQDYSSKYRMNGAIYLVNVKKLLDQNSFILDELNYGFVMQRQDSVDVDEYIDFKFAEVLLSERKQH